jgi:hypothetical protein
VRVEEGLDLAERAHELRPEIVLQERPAGAAVPMLAGHHPAEFLGEVGRPQGDAVHPRLVGGIGEVQQRTHVQDPDRRVGVERRDRALVLDDRAEPPDELAEPLGRHGVVLDEAERLAPARDRVEKRLAGLAQLPRAGHRSRVGVRLHRRVRQQRPQSSEALAHLVHALL